MVQNNLPTLKFSEYKFQIMAIACANIISISHGVALGWLSPALVILQSDHSPLDSGRISVTEASWLGSIMCFGAITGNLILGFIINHFGRKKALMFLALPHAGFWIIVMFANHINYLYVARILAGVSGGGLFVVLPVFVADIANKAIRGSLGSYMLIGVNFGTLVGFIAGAYLDYSTVPRIFVGLSILFLIGISFFPETPQFLLQKGNENAAKNSVIFYNSLGSTERHDTQKLNEILDEIKSTNSNSKDEGSGGLKWSDFSNPVARKSLLLGIGLVSANILSGCFALINYTATIFKSTGTEIDPNLSTVIIGIVQVSGSYTNTLIVDHLGRRLLLALTLSGCALSYAVIGFYSYFNEYLSQLSWIPTLTLSIVIFSASAGFLPLTFVVLAEVLPAKIRPIGFGLCNGFLNILAFASLFLYPALIEQIGLYFVMWICGASCLVFVLFTILCIPETRGKVI